MRSLTGAEEDVARLLNPKSIAVIGASGRPQTLSWWPAELLRKSGFTGAIYLVNPTRDVIDGMPCYSSVGDIQDPPDVAVIATGADRSIEVVRECAAAGVRAVVLPTQGFAEAGEEGLQKERALSELTGPGKLRIVGTNTDGVANFASGAIGSIQPLLARGINSGPVAVVTQSGATGGSLLVRLKHERIGCRLYASTGNETDLGLADFMSVMVQDPEVKLILSFVEMLRRPDDFVKVAQLAAEFSKPIALIKVGRSEAGARRAAAHTGALAGSDELYQALFDAYGVIRVSELSEIVALAKLYLSGGSPKSRTVGIFSVSGGQAGALADKASSLGLSVPAVSKKTEQLLNEVLPAGKGFNPCDLTGAIARRPELAADVYEAFAGERTLGCIVYARKALTGTVSEEIAELLGQAVARHGSAAPLSVYAMDGEIAGTELEYLSAAGIPILSSLNDLFVAVDRLAWHRAFVVGDHWKTLPRKDTNGARPVTGFDESDTRRVLAEYGLHTPKAIVATSATTAVEAAQRIGYPVVLKVVSKRIPHKTEAGGVALGVKDDHAVALQYGRVWNNARHFLNGDDPDGVLVQEQFEDGIEFIVGATVDDHLGAFVLVGLGGVLTEMLNDVVLHPAPVDAAIADRMISRLQGAPLLDGFRGRPPADRAALVDTVVKLSHVAADYRHVVAEADLNPVLVLPAGEGVRVVDALFVPRR